MMLAILFLPVFCAAEEQGITGLTAHDIVDNRQTLDLSPRMKHRLLSNMREQLSATRNIIGMLGQDNFEAAARTARAKLGMTEGLQQVYNASNNQEFIKLGMTASASADTLAITLKSKDLKKSLQALREAMAICVQCHNRFRQ